ncbi:MAG: GNAT family N-acetyltransferase [Candidatus Sumerlaeia bacterium]|nr:GNAT family N-acetyltransferase [Candidatus Sumerlaeia bacterium]
MLVERAQLAYTSVLEPLLYLPEGELRLPTAQDAEALARYALRNKEFHQPWEPVRPAGFTSVEFWERRIRAIQSDFRNGTAMRLYLIQPQSRRVLAYISYSNIQRGIAQNCTLGYSLDEAAQGHGIMTRALRLTNSYVFEDLGLRRIMAYYIPRNTRSGNLLKRVGFQEEGLAREFLCINGKWEDHVITSLINRDFA